jgi:hypothetical protein
MKEVMFAMLLLLLAGAVEARPEKVDRQEMVLRREVQRAAREGYDVAPVEALLDPAVWRGAARELQIDPSAARRDCLRRARGMLIALKLPRWVRIARFVQPKRKVLPPRGNVAATATGTTWKASITYGVASYEASAALDGDTINPESYWAGPNDSGTPQTLELDFHRTVTLSRCLIYWYGERIRGTAYDLDAWDEVRNQWAAVFREEDNRKEVAEYEFTPVSTARVRLTIRAVVGQNRVVMREFMLFGPETPKEAIVARPGPMQELGPRDVAALGSSWGMCFGVARPVIRPEAVDFWHDRGNRAAFYLEGCLSPISMVLMPGQRQWVTPASIAYANAYWHNNQESSFTITGRCGIIGYSWRGGESTRWGRRGEPI